MSIKINTDRGDEIIINNKSIIDYASKNNRGAVVSINKGVFPIDDESYELLKKELSDDENH